MQFQRDRVKNNQGAKWIAGIAATASAGAAQGVLVQIDLVNNSITAGGGNQLNADLVGDGIGDDIFLRSAEFISYLVSFETQFVGRVQLDGVLMGASSVGKRFEAFIGSTAVGTNEGRIGYSGGTHSGFFPIVFDASTRAGANAQNGYLFVGAGGEFATRGLTLSRLIWDDSTVDLPNIADVQAGPIVSIGSTENGVFTPVPEPSGLALLALGAGGIVLRRQRKAQLRS